MKIRKGDKVVVLAGKDKGKEGEVSFLYPKEERQCKVESLTKKWHLTFLMWLLSVLRMENPLALDTDSIATERK